MNFILIVILITVATISTSLYLLYLLFSQHEKLFKKNLQVGDSCCYYPNETEDLLCEIVEIKGDRVKIKDKDGISYETDIENISSP